MCHFMCFGWKDGCLCVTLVPTRRSAGFVWTVHLNRCEDPVSQDGEQKPSFQAVGECSVTPRSKNTWLKNPPGLPLVFPKTFLQEAPSVLNELVPVPE